jgi:hypothetical protein
MFPIAQINGTGAAGSFSFSNIPQTFAHLQLRLYTRSYTTGSLINHYFNADYAATNYTQHWGYGNGTTATAGTAQSQPYAYLPYGSTQSTDLANAYAVSIIDIHDYTSTNKFKVLKSIGGYDLNASGIVTMYSAMWSSTAAITSWTLTPGFATGSVAVLYGITNSTVSGA